MYVPTKLNKMNKQLNLFDNVNEATNPACFLGAVMRSALVDTNKVIKTVKWKEFHENGQLWIDGEIAIIKDEFKHLYDCRYEYKDYPGQPVVKIGVWTKCFDNGQLAWQLDFGDGMYDSKIKRRSFTAYRKDGTAVVY